MPTLNSDAFRNNTRVYYAMKGVAIGNIGASSIQDSWNRGNTPLASGGNKMLIMHGIQSMGINTNFNLEQIFEFGQLSLYVNQEDVPDIEITTQKFLDGYTLVYHAATQNAVAATLSARSDTRCDVRMAIVKSTDSAVNSGVLAAGELYASGAYVSSIGYSLPTDGTFAESISFVGNNKKWISSQNDTESLLITSGVLVDSAFGTIFGSDQPTYNNGNVLKRQNLVTGSTGRTFGGTQYRTVLPNFITNITGSGQVVGSRYATNSNTFTTAVSGGAHVQSIEINCDLGREAINQLGTFAPYNRYATFPVEVTTTIEVIANAGDNITAVETSNSNLSNHEICIVLDDSTVIHTGKKNKVTSVSFGGGDAGGGNDTITYTMSNFNDLVVLHSGDPVLHTLGAAAYWKDYFA